MKKQKSNDPLILSIHPITQGFGYAFFEGIHTPIDWGVCHVNKNKNAACLKKVQAIIERFKPDIVVLEDYKGKDSKRAPRIQRLIDAIALRAKKSDIKVATYSRGQIRLCFARFNAQTKYEIAKVIVRYMSDFQPQLPPPRKAWLPEDYRMSIFDAVALIYTHIYFVNFKQNTKEMEMRK